MLCGCLLTGLGSGTAPYLEDKIAKAQIVNNLQKVIQPIRAVPRWVPGCPEAQPLALANWQGETAVWFEQGALAPATLSLSPTIAQVV